MSRPRRRVALVVLCGLLPALAACSTVPLSSATVQIPLTSPRPAPEVGIEPQSPEPGATPEEIVGGFIEAAASTQAGHPVARQYLTEAAADAWSDEGGISVISQDYSVSVTGDDTVQVSADLVGTVDERGIFTVEDRDFPPRVFALEEVDEQWRIANPPDGLIMLQPDFERLYDRLQAFFLDPTGTRLVPDPRYLITGDAQPTVLLDRVLQGPSAALSAGVRNPLSSPVQLRSAVEVDGQEAVVDLTGLGADPAPSLPQICAQVVWTLRQVGIQNVEIRVDGELVRLENVPPRQTVDDWASFGPDVVPVDGVGHYLADGAVRVATTGDPIAGPAGAGDYGLLSAVVKADVRTGDLAFLAGVRTLGAVQQLLTGAYGGPLNARVEGTSFTAPTVAATRPEVWTVRETSTGTGIVRVLLTDNSSQGVEATTLPAQTEVLQLSPDGVRAAVVGDSTLYVGTVVRAEDGPVALRDLRPVAPSLPQVVDVAWRDSEELLVLAGGGGDDPVTPYLVGVDGWGLDDVSVARLPSEPDSIAAAPNRQPLVSANGQIWQLVGGTWRTLEPGAEPRRGTEPFFPL